MYICGLLKNGIDKLTYKTEIEIQIHRTNDTKRAKRV